MMHPAVPRALDAIERQLELVRLDFPDLPPREQLQIARSRCPDEIAAANVAVDLEAVQRPVPRPVTFDSQPQKLGELFPSGNPLVPHPFCKLSALLDVRRG